MTLTLRRATLDDVPRIMDIMEAAIAELQQGFLDAATIEASRAVMGLDTTLITDGTYYVAESDSVIAGCGGWSRRTTLFGGNHSAGRSDALLDPATEPARFRAMYTHPAFTRRGIGGAILNHAEQAALAEGFSEGILMATLAGVPLYRHKGWLEIAPHDAVLPDGRAVPMVRMGKTLQHHAG